jgi:hypothetical protein
MMGTTTTVNNSYHQVVWYTGTTSASNIIVNNAGNYITGTGGGYTTTSDAIIREIEVQAPTKLLPGTTYNMPDGSKVIIGADGGFTIDDKYARRLYKAAKVHDFNPFLNAADLIEEYIQELVPQGIRQDEVLHLEIEKFIFWLVHKAAEKDNDPIPQDIPRLPDLRRIKTLPRCGYCARFIRKAWARAQVNFCSPIHMERKMIKGGLL